jgi:hypothetical protein
VAHRQRVEETGNRPLEMVAAQILDSSSTATSNTAATADSIAHLTRDVPP